MEFKLVTLESKRLVLREIELSDKLDLYTYASDIRVAQCMTWDVHQTLADTDQYLDFIFVQRQRNGVRPWGIEWKETGTLIGTIDFIWWDTKHQVAEVGYALSSDYWGKGIMTEALSAVINFGFREMNLVRIQAKCVVENIGSARVMEKSGMTYEGVQRKGILLKGKHRDLKMYGITNDEFKS